VQNVAAKKPYVVPVVVAQSAVEQKTLGVPEGIGEPSVGLYRVGGV
jgi:hypothetical protein